MAWAPDYLTLAELKSWLRVADTVDDTELAAAITAASRAIDTATHRQFGQLAAPAEWVYTPQWDRKRCRWVVHIDDLATTTGVVVEIDGTATTDYTLEPRNAVSKGMVWTRLVLGEDVTVPAGETAGEAQRDSAGITAPWGWAAVPTAVKLATRLQASRFAARRDSPYGVAGSPQNGSELRLLARVDPDVAVSLHRYIREVWAA
jgi:hypothetical protein